jgi:hypothetical protein
MRSFSVMNSTNETARIVRTAAISNVMEPGLHVILSATPPAGNHSNRQPCSGARCKKSYLLRLLEKTIRCSNPTLTLTLPLFTTANPAICIYSTDYTFLCFTDTQQRTVSFISAASIIYEPSSFDQILT